MAPKYSDQQQPLPEEYVAAICRALGIFGEFKPLIHDVAATRQGRNGDGAIENMIELPTLPYVER
jgi:hypothetical protein